VLFRTGDKLVVGVTHDPPYLMKRAGGEWTGINADIWKAMTHTMEVDYEFREMTFEQLLDALEKRTIDIAVEMVFFATKSRFIITGKTITRTGFPFTRQTRKNTISPLASPGKARTGRRLTAPSST